MTPWIALIARYGVPTAYEIWNTWKSKTEPTQADWDKLLALADKTTDSYIQEAKNNLG